MKKLILFLLFISFISCVETENEINGDCYVSPDPEMICTEEYNPVCACNDLVYSNSCKAEKAGNLKWRLTNQDSGEECSF
jgi:hypothetical protein